MRVVVWNEHVHERRPGRAAEVYPEGIHAALAATLRRELGPAASVGTATLAEPGHGLPPEVLDEVDVLLWWGHLAHAEVADELAARVQQRVLDGMGLVVLHSAHLSKPFRLLMGTSCNLRWREADDRELVWVVDPAHPVVDGLPPVIPLERHEMYGEHFDIPAPDDLVLISSFTGGEVFRSGCGFRRGKGRIFYLGPGHETYPIYHNPLIQRLVVNATRWAAPGAPAATETTRTSPQSPTGWFEAPGG